MSEANEVATPCEKQAYVENKTKLENVPYREAVGSLMFLEIVSRPDIAFAVSIVSQS